MPYKTIQQNFANGELNPKMQGRADVDMYYKSAQKMRDVVTTPYGGFVRRPGSKVIASVASSYEETGSKNVKLFPFILDNNRSYLLAVSAGQIEIFYNDELIKTLEVPEFSEDRINSIKYIQNASTAFFVHPDFKPKRLSMGGVSPVFDNMEIENDLLKLSEISNVDTRVAIGNTKIEYPFSVENSDLEFGFCVLSTGRTYTGSDSNYTKQQKFTIYNENGIELFSFNFMEMETSCYAAAYIRKPNNTLASIYNTFTRADLSEDIFYRLKVTYSHSSGSWELLKKENEGEWTSLGTLTQSFSETKAKKIEFYSSMRIRTNGFDTQNKISLDDDDTYVKVGENTAWNYSLMSPDGFSIYDFSFNSIPKYNFGAETKTTGNTTAKPDQLDGVVTITLGSNVSANLVGQYFEGNGARVKITSQNGTKLTGYTIIGFYSTDQIAAGNWSYTTTYEDVWSDTRGWPCSVTFHGGRLWFGGSKSLPQTVWGSRVGMFDKFDSTSGYDNDAIEFTIDTADLNKITDIYSQKNLIIFTLGGEFVCASSYNEPITPSNVNAVKQTANGSWENTHPVDIEGAVMFVERKGQGLMAFAANENTTDIYNSANSSLINSHLIKSPVDISVERNNLTQQTNYVYLVNSDGTLCVVNLLASQGITGGYTLWQTQGMYKSICVLPSATYTIVERGSGSSYKMYLEKLDFDLLIDGVYSTSVTDESSVTVSRFAGKNVDVFLNGEFLINTTADDSGVISFEQEITGDITIGYAFRWVVESNFLEIPQLGIGISRKKRMATMTVRTLDTKELTVNGETQPGGEGIYDIEYYGVGDWSEHPTWIMQEQKPCKVNVMAVQMNVNYQVAGDEY